MDQKIHLAINRFVVINSIAEYYLDELSDWKSAIDVYIEEIDEGQDWLQEILRFDTVPLLAAKVEHFMNGLSLSRENLLYLRSFIESFEKRLYKDHIPVSNASVSEQEKSWHKELRQNMHKVEKEYLGLKYDCDEFLAGAVDIQSRMPRNSSV